MSIRRSTRPKNSFEFVTVRGARAPVAERLHAEVEGSPKAARLAQQEVTQGTVSRNEPADD